jgi:hypothetical protein
LPAPGAAIVEEHERSLATIAPPDQAKTAACAGGSQGRRVGRLSNSATCTAGDRLAARPRGGSSAGGRGVRPRRGRKRRRVFRGGFPRTRCEVVGRNRAGRHARRSGSRAGSRAGEQRRTVLGEASALPVERLQSLAARPAVRDAGRVAIGGEDLLGAGVEPRGSRCGPAGGRAARRPRPRAPASRPRRDGDHCR